MRPTWRKLYGPTRAHDRVLIQNGEFVRWTFGMDCGLGPSMIVFSQENNPCVWVDEPVHSSVYEQIQRTAARPIFRLTIERHCVVPCILQQAQHIATGPIHLPELFNTLSVMRQMRERAERDVLETSESQLLEENTYNNSNGLVAIGVPVRSPVQFADQRKPHAPVENLPAQSARHEAWLRKLQSTDPRAFALKQALARSEQSLGTGKNE